MLMGDLGFSAQYPLVSHQSVDEIVAWRKGVAITVAQFLEDVAQLAALMPAGKYLLNICHDRYHFTVGLAAAIVSGKVSLLPPNHTPEMVRQLKDFAGDVFCLHDSANCTIGLPLMLYPAERDIPSRELTKREIPEIDALQQVAILFTSGTTGRPLPHSKCWGALVRNVRAEAERLGLLNDRSYAILGTVPPQHMYGLESTVMVALHSGNALVSGHPFYPADICEAIQMLPVPRVLVSTPVHMRLLFESELDIAELALVVSATAPLSPQLALAIEAKTQCPLIEIYGSTETGQVASRRPTQSDEWQLLPGVQLTQRGTETWATGAHIEVPVPLNDVIETTRENYFLLCGRTSDIINIAGKRGSLASLNHLLNSIPGVLDGAFFMPDEISHDHVTRLVACVVAPTLDSQVLIQALRERMDAVFLPRRLIFVDELPRNSTGKLPREALKTLIEAEVGKQLA